MSFVRHSKLQLTAKFTPPPGVALIPVSAHATLVYTNVSGQTQTDNITLNPQPDGSWMGTWDSSNARQGRVEWMAYCQGNVQAATQGAFEIKANKANLAT